MNKNEKKLLPGNYKQSNHKEKLSFKLVALI